MGHIIWVFFPLCMNLSESLPQLFKDCCITRAVWFAFLSLRPESLNLKSGVDIISFLLSQSLISGGNLFVLKWLLMAKCIWRHRNSILFNGGSVLVDELVKEVTILSHLCEEYWFAWIATILSWRLYWLYCQWISRSSYLVFRSSCCKMLGSLFSGLSFVYP